MVPEDSVISSPNPFEGADAHNPAIRVLSRKFLWSTVAIILAGEAVYPAILLSGPPEQWFRASGPVLMVGVSLLAGFLLARGKAQAALHRLIYGVWAIITLVALINGGIRVPLVYAYPLVILVTGWMISGRAAVIIAALTSLTTLALVLAQSLGLLRQVPEAPALLYAVSQVFVNILSAVLIIFLVQAYIRRLSELNAVSTGFAQRTRDLEMTRSELHQAQAVAKVGSWIYDLRSDTMRLSDETCRIFGLPLGTTGTHAAYLSRTVAEDRRELNQAWEAALAGEAFDHEHRIRVGESIRWVRQRAEMKRDADGSVFHAVGISQDITERKLADIGLRQSEKRFSTAFSSSPVASSIASLESGLVLEANDNFERDYGWTQADMIGHTTLEFGLWPDDLTRKAFAKAIRHNGRLVDYETVFMHKNGGHRNVSISGEVIELDGQACILAYTTDITARKRADAQIQNLAFFDPLTQLPNRRLLMDRLKQSLASGTRRQRLGALLFIDLDNFKTLNDTHGHDKGDQLLQLVAQRLTASVRECDTVARLGGDEFVVMLEDLSENPVEAVTQTKVVAEKILETLNQNYQLAHYVHHSTPSIGVTLFGGQPEDIEEPLKRADLAMYQSKTAGRNTIRFFDPQMQAVVAARASLELGLREALAEEHFLLYYQPQVMGENLVTGAEVLLRWKHPQRGLVSPAEFIPLAEETGLILPLGNWVLETACAQLARWCGNPALTHLTVSVNVSTRQFHQTDFVDQVLSVLARTGANPNRLKLELTESLLVSNFDDVIAKMNTLQTHGVGFALDDFGTGYSSLSYLKRLPLDQIKIDQSFVRDILIDPNDAAIAKMVIVLAESLGLLVVAEGVETQAQKDALAGQGCHAYQGYLFSRPLPIEEFEAFLLNR